MNEAELIAAAITSDRSCDQIILSGARSWSVSAVSSVRYTGIKRNFGEGARDNAWIPKARS